jgi:hypothetical protein
MHAGRHAARNQPASPVSKIAYLLSECGCAVTIDVTRLQPYSSSHLSSITNGQQELCNYRTERTVDLKKFDAAGRASARLVKDAKLIVYEGAPHGLTDTHRDGLNADLLNFVRQAAPAGVR